MRGSSYSVTPEPARPAWLENIAALYSFDLSWDGVHNRWHLFTGVDDTRGGEEIVSVETYDTLKSIVEILKKRGITHGARNLR